MSNSFDRLAARYVLGRLRSEDVPALAMAALENGCPSDTVAVLAGMDQPTWRDMDALIIALVHEVGRSLPSHSDADKILTDEQAELIVGGQVSPVAGAWEIWQLGDCPADRARWIDVRPFIGLASEADASGIDLDELNRQIVREARALLARGGLRADTESPDFVGRYVQRCRVTEHVLSDRRTLQAITLTIDGADTRTIDVASDGQSIAITSTEPRQFSMSEYGDFVAADDHWVSNLLTRSGWIVRADDLVDTDGLRIGVCFELSDGDTLFVFNWGDELCAARELPDYVSQELRTDLRRGDQA